MLAEAFYKENIAVGAFSKYCSFHSEHCHPSLTRLRPGRSGCWRTWSTRTLWTWSRCSGGSGSCTSCSSSAITPSSTSWRSIPRGSPCPSQRWGGNEKFRKYSIKVGAANEKIRSWILFKVQRMWMKDGFTVQQMYEISSPFLIKQYKLELLFSSFEGSKESDLRFKLQ